MKDDYAIYALPTLPVIAVPEFEAAIEVAATDPESQALLNILAAATLNMAKSPRADEPERQSQIKSLCYSALQLRGPIMPGHNLSVKSVMVPLLVASYLFTTDRESIMGWYYLSEAVTCVSLLYKKQTDATTPSPGYNQLQRLYWLIWMHERFYTITSRRRPTLSTLSSMPPIDPDLPAPVSKGFTHLMSLWKTIDDTFVANWLDEKSTSLTPAWIEAKQSQLGIDDHQWEDDTTDLTEKQQVDLLVTRCWFRTLIWQMALSAFLLKSDEHSPANFMDFTFPAHISRQLRVVLTNAPRDVIGVYGTGVVHKAFDIVSTLADLLEHTLPRMCDSLTIADYVDDFSFMYTFLNSMPIFHDSERAVLKSRHKTLSAMYPNLTS